MKVKSVRSVPMGTSKVLGMYPTVVQKVWDFSPEARYQGGRDGAKHQGGLPPSTSMTNCSSVYQTAKTFGQKNRDNVYVLSRPVMPKKR
jgi:hypothetical protein